MKFADPEQTAQFESRSDFLDLLPKDATCAELGCMTGRFSRRIIERAKPKKLYLVDPYWKAYGERFPTGRKRNTWAAFSEAVKKVREADKFNCAIFVIGSDLVFLPDLPNGYFDWIYLDTTHEYEDTVKELHLLQRKVKEDGLICGHDYWPDLKHRHHGVALAITEYLENNVDYELALVDNHTQWIVKKRQVKLNGVS